MVRSVSLAALLVLGGALGGCAEDAYYPPVPTRALNTVIGQAEVARAGHVATCAHDEATLLPVTRATTARMERLYGGANYTVINAGMHIARDPAIDRMARHAACDPRGFFRFAAVPDGNYYLVAGVHGAEHGSVRREVAIYGGVAHHVTLGG